MGNATIQSTKEGQIRGIIRKINSANGFAAIEIGLEEYAVVELLGGDVDEGEEVSGDFQSLGPAALVKIRNGEHLRVFVQDRLASAERANDLLTQR